MVNDDAFEDDTSPAAKYEAKQLFHEAYQAQLAENYEEAIELYKRSIETYPTAEAHTFLGWVYSFQDRYDEAIDWPKAIPIAACAGSNGRYMRRVTSRTRFRISTSAGFTKRAKSISMLPDITARRLNNSPASPKPPVDFIGCKRC